MGRVKFYLFLLIAFLLSIDGSAQNISIPKIDTPKPATISAPTLLTFSGLPSSFSSSVPIVSEPLAVWKADQARVANLDMFMNELFEDIPNSGMSYRFPSKNHLEGVEAYYEAFEEISAMLDGLTELDLKKAIFAVENAYFNNQGSFEDFDNQIKDLAELTSEYITQQGWDKTNPITPLLALHHLFADTLEIEQAGMEEAIVHYPIEYDFEDFWGREDFSNLFVSKVLATGSGQCYSLPQLYLLLAEELGGKAWLSLSPNHSYIKFKDTEDQWYNLELTNGNLVSESWMLASGYVTIETIQNGIYMDTLSVKETVAMKLVDLALSFGSKYGYDEFVIKATDKALEHHPENISGILTKTNYYTELVRHVATQKNNPTNEEYLADPYAKAILVMRERMYNLIDNSGYRAIPEEAYTEWLNSLDEYKAQQEENKKTINSERPNNN